MNQETAVPKVKKVRYESIFSRGCQSRMVTKVYFKDGTALTFVGSLKKKEARAQAYYRKGLDAGWTEEEAALFAERGPV